MKLHILLFNNVYPFVSRIPLHTHTYIFFFKLKKELTIFSKVITLGHSFVIDTALILIKL